MAVELKPLPPRDAIAALRARGKRLEPSFAWEDVWQDTHATMFTVAKSAGFDILNDLFDGLETALAEGELESDFQKRLRPILQAKGWWGKAPALDPATGEMEIAQLGSVRRLNTIFDVNMRVSYAAGHWANFERNKAARPWLRYVAILDGRARPAHAARHNLCLPVDHPYWNRWAPPCGWGCRCTLQSLSDRDVERMRSQLKFEPPADVEVEYTNSRTGVVVRVPAGIDPGWAYNPGKAGWQAANAAEKLATSEAVVKATLAPKPKPDPLKMAVDAITEIFEHPAEIQDELDGARAAILQAGEPFDRLSIEQAALIRWYTGSGYRRFNQALREGKRSASLMRRRDALDAALEVLPAITGSLRRGIDIPSLDAFLEEYRPGRIVRFRAFTSASSGTGFSGNVRYDIIALSGRSIDPISAAKGEDEVLFQTGARFRVLAVTRNGDRVNITLRELPRAKRATQAARRERAYVPTAEERRFIAEAEQRFAQWPDKADPAMAHLSDKMQSGGPGEIED